MNSNVGNEDKNMMLLKKYIESLVEKIYEKFSYLFPEDIEKLKEKALEKYLKPLDNESLTTRLDSILEQMTSEVENRKKEYQDKQKKIDNIPPIEEQKHYDLNDLFDCRITGNCLHIHVVPSSIKEDMMTAGGPTKYLNDVVTPKLDDALNKVVDILNNYEKDINVIVAVSPTLRLSQDLFRKEGFDVSQTKEEMFIKMFGDKEIYKAVISREDLLKRQEVIEQNTNSNEINNMLDDNPNVNVTTDINTNNDISKQYVKKDNKKQSGSISLFSIGLSILVITTFILIALILNVLLK